MKLLKTKLFSLLFYFLLFCFFHPSYSQDNGAKKYDELLNAIPSETATPQLQQETVTEQQINIQEIPEANELIPLLPKLDSEIYRGWSIVSVPTIWKPNDELLTELGIEIALEQTYKNENHIVDVILYKFKDFAAAYSAYTVLHSGASTKLKVGRNASESEKLINFWKGNYYIDIHTTEENDHAAKEFIILFSQDISNNIQADDLPPAVAVQLPALYRVQSSEKYCLGTLCCEKFISKVLQGFNCSTFNLVESGGIITAEYQILEERISLVLTRYKKEEDSQQVFNSLLESTKNIKDEDKKAGVDINHDDSIVNIKNKKKDYTMFKQRGNLLAIAYGLTNKKAGKQILDLVPWPIEIQH